MSAPVSARDSGAWHFSHLPRWVGLGFLLFCLGCSRASRGATSGQLYLLQRDVADWMLASADVATGASVVLLADVGGFAPGAAAFAVVTQDEQALELWADGRLQLLHACAAPCYDPVWAPGAATALAWLEGDYPALRAWVWMGEQPLALGLAAGRPVWSPDGARLAFAGQNGLVLWSVGSTVTETLPYLAQAQPAWSPNGNRLAIVVFPGDVLVLTLGQTFPPPQVLELKGAQAAEVSWSATGDRLALTLRRFNPPAAHAEGQPHIDERPGAETLGPQPWLYDLTTGALQALPGDASATFARPTWSPDGHLLALVHLPLGVPVPRPEVWIIEAAANTVVQRISDAAAPAWGP